MPAVSPLIDGVTVIVPAFVPLAGDRLSQPRSPTPSSPAMPPPVLEIDSVLAAGLAPPSVAANDSAAGDTDSAGGVGGSTVSVTVTVFGEPVAPAAASVMSSV